MNVLLITDDAFLDIQEITLYYESIRTGLSLDFELCLESGFDEITKSPSLFQCRYKEVRIRFIERFPYGVHYIFHKNTIQVIGVFHTSRSPKNWKMRHKK